MLRALLILLVCIATSYCSNDTAVLAKPVGKITLIPSEK